jgi:trimethylamine--corrinoid protein Co-methyltransferase
MSRRRQRRQPGVERTPPVLFQRLQNRWSPYQILDPGQLETLHDASMTILEDIGLDFMDAEALAIWAAAGAKVDHKAQHVWIDRGLVAAALATAPSNFTWRARNPAHNVHIGGHEITFGPPGGMVYISDLDNGRRPGRMADYENLLRLTQLCPHIHFGPWEQVTAHDIPVNVRHLHRLRAGIQLTDKALMEAAHGRIITADNLAIAHLLFGSLDGNPVIGDVINVNSPLRFDERMLGGLISYARAGQVAFITPFILAGAMAPLTMAAALAQQNAEALAGITLTQLVRPGAPVIYGGFTTNTDLKSGSPAFGTPEGAWALLVGGQLARRYGLPYRGSGGLSNSNLADAQAALESQWNLWPVVLAHTNLVMHAAGWLEGGLTVSMEKFMLDAEALAMFARFLAGFAINPDELALDMIAAVGPGGHHFGTPHTQARFRDAFHQSSLADRANFASWQEAGGLDLAQRANALWKQQLRSYEPPPLDEAIRDAIDDYITRRTRELAGVALYD